MPFVIDDAIIIAAAAAAGAVGGSIAQGKRTRSNYQNLVRAQWEAEQLKKNKDRTKRILTGDMSIAALQNTAQSREAAMEAFQGESKGEAALGVSGMSSGTPFYKLQQDIRDNATRLAEMDEMARISMGNRTAQAGAATDQNIVAEARADWAVADLQAQQNYLDDPLSAMMAVGTGALQGAATGMQISAGLTKLGIFDKPLAPGGLPSSKGNEWLYSGDEGRMDFGFQPDAWNGSSVMMDPPSLWNGSSLMGDTGSDSFSLHPAVGPQIDPTAIQSAFMNPNQDMADRFGFSFSDDLWKMKPINYGSMFSFKLGGY